MPRSVRVYYVRHGESAWNARQRSQRRKGVDEQTIRDEGVANPAFIDAPLSADGVRQTLELRHALFGEPPPGYFETRHPDDLGGLLRCAEFRRCKPPAVYVSNLRRAIGTAIFVLRPMLESDRTYVPSRPPTLQKLTVLPSLQEPCPYTDCTPLPLRSDGRLALAMPSDRARTTITHDLEEMETTAEVGMERIREVLMGEAEMIGKTSHEEHLEAVARFREHQAHTQPSEFAEAGYMVHVAPNETTKSLYTCLSKQTPPSDTFWPQPVQCFVDAVGLGHERTEPVNLPPVAHDLNAYIRHQYRRHVVLGPISEGAAYDDRRRLPDTTLAVAHALDAPSLHARLAPLANRLGDVFGQVLTRQPDGATARRRARADGDDVLIVGHSRLLREMVFAFVHGRGLSITTTLPPGAPERTVVLRVDEPSVSDACRTLADERYALNSAGTLAFDLQLCEPPECGTPSLTLANCDLAANGRVVGRHDHPDAAPLFVVDPGPRPPRHVDAEVGMALWGLAAVGLASLVVRRLRRRRPRVGVKDT